jgi:hypothetical protein
MTNTQPLLIHETPAAPVACDMTTATDTPEERLAEYGRLFAEALIDRKRTDDAVVFVFAAKPGIADRAAELARREALCCPFASYQVTVEGERVVWRTSSQAGPVAQAIVDELYGLPEQMGRFARAFCGARGSKCWEQACEICETFARDGMSLYGFNPHGLTDVSLRAADRAADQRR